MSMITIRPATYHDTSDLVELEHLVRSQLSRESTAKGKGHQLRLVAFAGNILVAELLVGIANNQVELHQLLGYDIAPEDKFPVLVIGRSIALHAVFERTLLNFVLEEASDLTIHTIFQIAEPPNDSEYKLRSQLGWKCGLVKSTDAIVVWRLPAQYAAGAALPRLGGIETMKYDHQYRGTPIARVLGL